YFFNPNIYPHQEYEKRKITAVTVGQLTETTIIEGESDPKLWENVCKEYRDAPEGGARCRLCYQMRLRKTFEKAKELAFDCFTTTLTISPHKKSAVVFEVGAQIAADRFLAIDFKKKDGFKKTMALARQYNLYHQNYCGCVYSQSAIR
ncbi:MAG: epoxyqueuosine reductase QueH, partial [Candidatus Omnitrophica bacterium]|nr:epoxyqueuosine reductase QueH [Candidatus Omnitrophota bacterium]